MNIEKISRSKSYEMVTPFGLKIWDKLGVEATLGENEDPKEGYRTLGELIEETHKENLKGWEELPIQQTHKSEKTMIEEMEACATFDEMNSFRFTVKNDAEKLVYETKLNELSPKK